MSMSRCCRRRYPLFFDANEEAGVSATRFVPTAVARLVHEHVARHAIGRAAGGSPATFPRLPLLPLLPLLLLLTRLLLRLQLWQSVQIGAGEGAGLSGFNVVLAGVWLQVGRPIRWGGRPSGEG